MYQTSSHIVGNPPLELKEFKHLLIPSVSRHWATGACNTCNADKD